MARDTQTDLPKADVFNTDLQSVITKSKKNNFESTIIFLDIDYFLKFNNEFGQEIGDKAIIQIADLLNNHTPKNTLIYRYSGDKFALIMSETEKENAFLIMNNILNKFNPEGSITLDGTDYKTDLSFSVGIASTPDDGTKVDEIIRKVEGALFRAKKAGRNRVLLSRNEKMITKTSHYTYEQLERLSNLAKTKNVGEALLLREALDNLLDKYDK